MRCPKCRHSLTTGAKYCHMCGLQLPLEIADRCIPWYYEPVFVLLAIFLFLAVFGMPLLWKSPRFSLRWKVIISLVTILYTGAIVWTTYYSIFYVLVPYYRQMLTVL